MEVENNKMQVVNDFNNKMTETVVNLNNKVNVVKERKKRSCSYSIFKYWKRSFVRVCANPLSGFGFYLSFLFNWKVRIEKLFLIFQFLDQVFLYFSNFKCIFRIEVQGYF